MANGASLPSNLIGVRTGDCLQLSGQSDEHPWRTVAVFQHAVDDHAGIQEAKLSMTRPLRISSRISAKTLRKVIRPWRIRQAIGVCYDIDEAWASAKKRAGTPA